MNESLKVSLINTFAAAQNVDGIKGNRLILVTGYGLISGIPFVETSDVVDDDRKLNLEEITSILIKETYKDRDRRNLKSDELSENDGFIVLTDVEITIGSSIANVPILSVFYDQIIGVTFGNLGHN